MLFELLHDTKIILLFELCLLFKQLYYNTSLVILCIMASNFKRRYLRFVTNHQEGRKIHVRSFYVSCSGKYGIKVSLCRHDIISNTR